MIKNNKRVVANKVKMFMMPMRRCTYKDKAMVYLWNHISSGTILA